MKKNQKHIRYWILGILFVIVLLLKLIPGGNTFYAHKIYPVVGTILSNISSLFPFAVSDFFVIASIVWLIGYPVYAFIKHLSWKQVLIKMGAFLALLFVWFYWAWGLNYGQDNYYQRTHTRPVQYDEEIFRDFIDRYIQSLNENYMKIAETDENVIRQSVMDAYSKFGFNRISNNHPKVKTMLYTPLASMVGVTGSMAPFFVEFTLNGDLLPHQYAATYAHEYAHLQGITSEREASFYAYLTTTRSENQAIRFSGYYSVLSYVLRNARQLLGTDSYGDMIKRIRPEIRDLYDADYAYWRAKYSEFIGKAQDHLFDFYLKSNKEPSGRKSYSEVIGLIISYEINNKELCIQEKNK